MSDEGVGFGKLSRTLRLLARPGMVWDESDGVLTLDVHSLREPGHRLIGYRFTPYDEAWAQDEGRTTQAFAELIELIAVMLGGTRRADIKPLTITGEIFNNGFMLNSFDLADLFELDQVFVEEDATRW